MFQENQYAVCHAGPVVTILLRFLMSLLFPDLIKDVIKCFKSVSQCLKLAMMRCIKQRLSRLATYSLSRAPFSN